MEWVPQFPVLELALKLLVFESAQELEPPIEPHIRRMKACTDP